MAITKGTAASKTGFGATTTLSVTAGSTNACLIVALAMDGNGVLEVLTYNGDAMTAITSAAGVAGNRTVRLYQLAPPDAGTHDIYLQLNSSNDYMLAALPLEGVDQTTPASNGTGATGSGSPITVNVTSAEGSLVIDGALVVHTGGGGTITVGASQNSDAEFDGFSSGAYSAGMSDEAGAATVTMSWTAGQAGTWVQAAASINAASASSGGFAPRAARSNQMAL